MGETNARKQDEICSFRFSCILLECYFKIAGLTQNRSSDNATSHYHLGHNPLPPSASPTALVTTHQFQSAHTAHNLRRLRRSWNVRHQTRSRIKHPPHHRHRWRELCPHTSSPRRVERRCTSGLPCWARRDEESCQGETERIAVLSRL